MGNFFTESKNIERDSYIWNMVGCILQSFQSVIFLMLLMRTVGLVQAGIFTIAYANANLFLNIGKYGMRYYQVSDVKEQYSFKEYKYSRVVTVVAMIAVSIIYTCYAVAVNNYSSEKAWIIILMCLYKAEDAVEDIFAGNYQKKGRLDIASKLLVIRTSLAILIYAVSLVLLQNQLYALIITTVASYVLMTWFLHYTEAHFHEREETVQLKQIMSLLKVCFPLFIGCFLSFYIGNASKYAIDNQLSDEIQACYGFIAMPVFVVEMINSFIFNPLLHQMALCWEKREISVFVRRMLVQIGIIVLIAIMCMVGAWFIGIPILSWMYHMDLAPYKIELLILLAGGGFLGVSGFLNAMITIIRFQKSVVLGYGIVAVLAFFLSEPIVKTYGIMGAAVLYTVLMGALSICFESLFILGLWKNIRADENL